MISYDDPCRKNPNRMRNPSSGFRHKDTVPRPTLADCRWALTMPFTLSHPAIVWPLDRLGLPTTAMVIGSMTPDLPYFLLLDANCKIGHDWLIGLHGIDMAFGFVLLTLWSILLRRPTLALLPEPARVRLDGPEPLPWSDAHRLVFTMLALWLGALSHLIWDSVTHGSRDDWWAATIWPALDKLVLLPIGPSLSVPEAFQLLSSSVGLLVVCVWITIVLRGRRPRPDALMATWSGRVKVMLVGSWMILSILVGMGYAAFRSFVDPSLSNRNFLINSAVAAIAGGFILSVLHAVFWRLRFAKGLAEAGGKTLRPSSAEPT